MNTDPKTAETAMEEPPDRALVAQVFVRDDILHALTVEWRRVVGERQAGGAK